MTGPFANRLFRIAFATAGVYNLVFGLWAGFWPLGFFKLFDLAPPQYPGIWACLGMVVGVYGLLYLHAAWRLETAWPIIAVGLLGKLLGPIGMVLSFGDDWPRRVGMLCIYNDLIWWLPFGLFLVRGTAIGSALARSAPILCATCHAVALVFLASFLKPGTLAVSDEWYRAAYVSDHVNVWTLGWFLWMLSAMSLVGFYAWWGSALSATRLAAAAVLLAAIGTVFDFSGEGLMSLVLVEHTERALEFKQGLSHPWDAEGFLAVERRVTLLCAGAANGLYTLGGILLTLATADLPKWLRALMWTTWTAGILMTVAAVLNSVTVLIVSSAIVFPSFILWTAWMGVRWRKL